ncbi:NAD(P)H-dependent glycerol-3-phosphate dehydrogenase [Aestuariispira insulae]|uniref:Glycerol-3-phosphate dehydrogenase [NAD(P)+] n=1 Tax=Aestuariispira insulae TaxID=1461337 RepID=A0A3D9HF51_9PROT|nr:NAD(P)H-dependent glycerol-3-phosphate dehydrogenase [Aestuariispira insulae]RED48108.1 glycerol-3-phosphate dehydrogenase (NAD(P)+) [Aestuariispira insulae]
MKANSVAVIGGGAFGTALACVARKAGNDVCIWARNQTVVADINEGRGNPLYLPDVSLESGITATTDMAEALEGAQAVLLVVPSQHLREIAERMAPHASGKAVALCSKGVERSTGKLMSEVAAQCLPDSGIAVLSGPTFARELALGLPGAVTLAATEEWVQNTILQTVGIPTFRPYVSNDVVGAEIGGAVKNVLAIACGIVTGRNLGENARAALVTRGLAEVMRLAVKLGARAETVMGLSGLGDLTLTCNSPQSRNMSFGIELGRGRTVAEILAERRAVTEGVWSAESVCDLADKLKVDMPICQAVNRIVSLDADIEKTISDVLNRPFRQEHG